MDHAGFPNLVPSRSNPGSTIEKYKFTLYFNRIWRRGRDFSPPFCKPSTNQKILIYVLKTAKHRRNAEPAAQLRRSCNDVPPRIGAGFVQPLYGVLCRTTEPPSKN